MPVAEYHLAWWRRWLARPFIRGGLRLLFHILAPVKIIGQENIPFGADILFHVKNIKNLKFFIEICEDVWVPIPPSSYAAMAGATSGPLCGRASQLQGETRRCPVRQPRNDPWEVRVVRPPRGASGHPGHHLEPGLRGVRSTQGIHLLHPQLLRRLSRQSRFHPAARRDGSPPDAWRGAGAASMAAPSRKA